MKRCCPESCEVTWAFYESTCRNDKGKGDCKYPNEAQPDETQCAKGRANFIAGISLKIILDIYLVKITKLYISLISLSLRG